MSDQAAVDALVAQVVICARCGEELTWAENQVEEVVLDGGGNVIGKQLLGQWLDTAWGESICYPHVDWSRVHIATWVVRPN